MRKHCNRIVTDNGQLLRRLTANTARQRMETFMSAFPQISLVHERAGECILPTTVAQFRVLPERRLCVLGKTALYGIIAVLKSKSKTRTVTACDLRVEVAKRMLLRCLRCAVNNFYIMPPCASTPMKRVSRPLRRGVPEPDRWMEKWVVRRRNCSSIFCVPPGKPPHDAQFQSLSCL